MSDDDKELDDILNMPSSEASTPKGRTFSRLDNTKSLMRELMLDDEEEKVLEQGYNQWSTSDYKTYKPSSSTLKALLPGVYEIKVSHTVGLYFEKIPVRTEGLVRFDDSNSDRVINEITNFWESEHLYDKYKLIYKRGIILWGPPGCGKSCTIQLVMEDVIQRGGIVLRFTDPGLFIDGMRTLRAIQPDTPVVVLMEDIDSIIEDWSESEVLNILDGVNEVHKTVFLATTNYPSKLGKRVINRPSRFDKRFKISALNYESRLIYFKHLFKDENHGQNLEKWATDTDNLSISHLKELFVAVVILKDEYEAAIKTLTKMKDEVKDNDGVKLGF